ncbi:MAG: sulfatase-like hydrolase/transferase, partial [Proteobacteria bacterium]|nr:sulfatase-like hydrolase/transferase [Pseudomonadota bacterium]
GEVLESLEKTGQSDSTLVLFTSEQGAQIPGCKWTNWELGVHTGFVVKWPGKVKPGVRTDALVQYADVLPTFMDAAGASFKETQFDGTSFLDVLEGKTDKHRKYVYAMHNNVPEGPAFPIRSVRSPKYSYIRNLSPERIYIEKHLMAVDDHNPYWDTWVFNSGNKPKAYQLVERFMRRPAEELYDLESDPLEFNNLAENADYASIKMMLSTELDVWMMHQADPGVELDSSKKLQMSKKGKNWQ